MPDRNKWLILASLGALGAACIAAGCYASAPLLWIVGGGALAWAGFQAVGRPSPAAVPATSPAGPPRPSILARPPVDPKDTRALVERMLSQGRYALLLRPQLVGNLTPGQFGQAREALKAAMPCIPDGTLVLGAEGGRKRAIHVGAFYLDRFPVTNRQFHEFVVAGGYEQIGLWDAAVWPSVGELVDRTGMPGPCFWRRGCFEAGEEDFPVVGVNWHEAAAYARWVGKRLPSDAEWTKAAEPRVGMGWADGSPPRRYPWGDEMDHRGANVWGTGRGRLAAVHEFAEGVSAAGAAQMIGNVWEWTSGNFRGTSLEPAEDDPWILPTPMKCIRGGAFDTYFDSQATCGFVSGEIPTRRRPNIGFRAAIAVSDLTLEFPGSSPGRAEGVAAAEAIPAAEPVSGASAAQAQEVCA